MTAHVYQNKPSTAVATCRLIKATGFPYRYLFQQQFNPRDCQVLSSDQLIYILWSVNGGLPNGPFTPDHFVSICLSCISKGASADATGKAKFCHTGIHDNTYERERLEITTITMDRFFKPSTLRGEDFYRMADEFVMDIEENEKDIMKFENTKLRPIWDPLTDKECNVPYCNVQISNFAKYVKHWSEIHAVCACVACTQ
ncbi:unnamed protein product [Mytilus edulis]|uniref:Uncharacterized protein n=1 Tax=Mytilus edulis TaxID=6550 RepID=A0A8S3U1M9_MYTED|nr:unnamed protein product [Mytilus edulis]